MAAALTELRGGRVRVEEETRLDVLAARLNGVEPQPLNGRRRPIGVVSLSGVGRFATKGMGQAPGAELAGMVEALLEANPGLAEGSPYVSAGVEATAPPRPTGRPVLPSINPWE